MPVGQGYKAWNKQSESVKHISYDQPTSQPVSLRSLMSGVIYTNSHSSRLPVSMDEHRTLYYDADQVQAQARNVNWMTSACIVMSRCVVQ